MKHFRSTLIALCLAWCACGCGAIRPTSFPNQLFGADGQTLTLDELDAVVQDTTLSLDDKRSALRDLGLEDEKLIEALLSL